MNGWTLANSGTGNTDSFLLRRDHPFFEGHFEGNPLLPGVLQLAWFLEIAGASANGWRIQNAKFHHEIKGGDTLRIEFIPLQDNARHFTLWKGVTLCGEAVLRKR